MRVSFPAHWTLQFKSLSVLGFQFQILDTVLQVQWQVMDTPTISVTSYGHSLDSSVTIYGHSPRLSVTLIARILKKKLKMKTKMMFFRIFTMLIMFLRVFYVIYVKMGLHVTVPLNKSCLFRQMRHRSWLDKLSRPKASFSFNFCV